MPNLTVGSWSEFQRQELLCPRPHSLANIVARDDEILVVVGLAPDDDMDMRVLRIPVIDSGPIEPRAKVALGVGHQVAREGFDIREFHGVIRRNNEPEMMPIVVASLSKSFLIDIVATA